MYRGLTEDDEPVAIKAGKPWGGMQKDLCDLNMFTYCYVFSSIVGPGDSNVATSFGAWMRGAVPRRTSFGKLLISVVSEKNIEG